MNSSESPFNNGVSYSVSATLSRSCMISTVSLPLIALILNKDLLDPTFIPSQFPNPSLIPSDSLILWMPISSGTNYHHFFNHRSLFNLLSAGWCWINLSLIPIILLASLLNPLYSSLFSPMCFPSSQSHSSCLLHHCPGAVIIFGEHYHAHCLSCYPLHMGHVQNLSIWHLVHQRLTLAYPTFSPSDRVCI